MWKIENENSRYLLRFNFLYQHLLRFNFLYQHLLRFNFLYQHLLTFNLLHFWSMDPTRASIPSSRHNIYCHSGATGWDWYWVIHVHPMLGVLKCDPLGSFVRLVSTGILLEQLPHGLNSKLKQFRSSSPAPDVPSSSAVRIPVRSKLAAALPWLCSLCCESSYAFHGSAIILCGKGSSSLPAESLKIQLHVLTCTHERQLQHDRWFCWFCWYTCMSHSAYYAVLGIPVAFCPEKCCSPDQYNPNTNMYFHSFPHPIPIASHIPFL